MSAITTITCEACQKQATTPTINLFGDARGLHAASLVRNWAFIECDLSENVHIYLCPDCAAKALKAVGVGIEVTPG